VPGWYWSREKKNVVLVGKRPGAQLVAQTGGFGIAMDTHIAEVGIKAGLHVASHIA